MHLQQLPANTKHTAVFVNNYDKHVHAKKHIKLEFNSDMETTISELFQLMTQKNLSSCSAAIGWDYEVIAHCHDNGKIATFRKRYGSQKISYMFEGNRYETLLSHHKQRLWSHLVDLQVFNTQDVVYELNLDMRTRVAW